MAKLAVNYQALDHAADQLDAAAVIAAEVATGTEADASAAGRPDVTSALSAFLTAWQQGAGLLVNNLTELSTFLRMSAGTYQTTDGDLTGHRGGPQ